MAAEESKKTQDTTTSADFKSTPMGQMMSQMMNMCCTGEGGFPACVSMMKPMKNESSRPREEPNAESEEKKK